MTAICIHMQVPKAMPSIELGSAWGNLSNPIFKFSQHVELPSVEINKEEPILQSLMGEAINKNLQIESYYFDRISRFLNLAQIEGFETPEFSGDLSDDVSFEWRNHAGNELVVTLKPDGKLVYSSLYDGGSNCGVDHFNGNEIPSIIKSSIQLCS